MDDEDDRKKKQKKKPYVMDSDHRLLLRVTKPLLQSRNAAVSICLQCISFLLNTACTSVNVCPSIFPACNTSLIACNVPSKRLCCDDMQIQR